MTTPDLIWAKGKGPRKPGLTSLSALRRGAGLLPASGVDLVKAVERLGLVRGVGVNTPLPLHRPVAALVVGVQVSREG